MDLDPSSSTGGGGGGGGGRTGTERRGDDQTTTPPQQPRQQINTRRRLSSIDEEHHHPNPQQQQQPACPRCTSTNTKFCYYNNYSLSQPRYFCKGCRRYWTHGGSLRNIPVGGGSRKPKRPRISAEEEETTQPPPPLPPPPPPPPPPQGLQLAGTAALSLPLPSPSSSAAPPSFPFPMINLINPSYQNYPHHHHHHHQQQLLPMAREGGFLSSLVAIHAMSAGAASSPLLFHQPSSAEPSTISTSSAVPSTNIGLLDFTSFPTMPPPPSPPPVWLRNPPHDDHQPNADARFWTIGSGTRAPAPAGDKTQDETSAVSAKPGSERGPPRPWPDDDNEAI